MTEMIRTEQTTTASRSATVHTAASRRPSVRGARPRAAGVRRGASLGPTPESHSAVAEAFDAQPRRELMGAELLARSDGELLSARTATDPAERFTHAHLAALRVAGAVLEVSAARPPRGRPRSAWERLGAVGEEFSDWSVFFASGAPLRSALAAGRFDAVDQVSADRWVEAAEDFREAVGVWVADRAAGSQEQAVAS